MSSASCRATDASLLMAHRGWLFSGYGRLRAMKVTAPIWLPVRAGLWAVWQAVTVGLEWRSTGWSSLPLNYHLHQHLTRPPANQVCCRHPPSSVHRRLKIPRERWSLGMQTYLMYVYDIFVCDIQLNIWAVRFRGGYQECTLQSHCYTL